MSDVNCHPAFISNSGRTYRFKDGHQTSVQFSKDEIACCSLYYLSDLSTVHIFKYDNTELTLSNVYSYPGGGFTDCSWNKNFDKILIVGSKNGSIVLYDTNVNNNKPSNVYSYHKSNVTSVCWCNFNKSNYFLSSAWSGETCLFDIQRNQPTQVFDKIQIPVFNSMWSPESDKVFGTACLDNRLRFHHLDDGSCTEYLLFPQSSEEFLTFDWSPHRDQQIAVGGLNYNNTPVIKLFDIRNMTREHSLFDSHADVITKIKFSPHHRNIFTSCSFDNTVKIWNANGLLQTILHHSNIVSCVDISQLDASLFVDCSFDRLLHLFRVNITSAHNYFSRL